MPREQGDDDADTFRILLATDIHIGYGEKDSVRGNDSLVSFEEILEQAQKHNVDLVLLGGDLFHENKPSRRMMHGCLSLLRKYCMGDRPVQFEFLSDESVNFEHCQFPTLNYEDQNFNISIPVFSIHGNHDDPTGVGNLCSLDLIHSAGLINYFGKTTSLEKIRVSPLLMQKGTTKLALYGLGSLKDERLHRLFLKKNVSMLRPRENQDDWFNLLTLHQNRAKHSDTNFIPEQFLDDFLDLIFWGHEHECRIVPEWNGMQNFYITQPGSSIATSLNEGETKQKHIGLLQIKGKDFKVTPIPLTTVRQFYLEDVVLADTTLNPNDPNVGRKIEAFCREKVEALLEKAESEHSGSRKQPKEPLIRLRVDYTGFDTFSINRFGRQFMNRVANPDQMILFNQRRKLGTKNKQDTDEDLELLASIRPQSLDTARVEDMVKDYFSKADSNHQLQVLTEKGMSEAVKEYVVKEEREAISELVKYQLQKTQKYLRVRNTDTEAIDAEVSRFKDERRQKHEDDEEVKEAIERAKSKRDANPDEDSRMDMDSDQESSSSATTSTRGRGRGRARGRGRGRGRGQTVHSDDDDSPSPAPPQRGKGARGRGTRGRGKAPVVVETGSRSVKDMFTAGNRRQTSQHASVKSTKYEDDFDDDGAHIISDDDNDDPFNIPSSRQKQAKKNSNSSSKRPRGIVFDSDTDEEDYTPVKKRR
ncbi:double-strand break repair protein MRE11-like [Littorina saxatilis]|uniref:Double-strand break repair protein n=1 Tax=Littorina saxatilis TaxID=31220 RepID=A0AAN9BVJ7_9CAEN